MINVIGVFRSWAKFTKVLIFSVIILLYDFLRYHATVIATNATSKAAYRDNAHQDSNKGLFINMER